MHKESGQLLAIKQVPVDSDLQDIIKEISIMQQCDRSAYPTSSLRTHTHTLYSIRLYRISLHKSSSSWVLAPLCRTQKHHFVVALLNGNGYFDTLLIEFLPPPSPPPHPLTPTSQYVVKYYGSYFKNTDLWVS